MAYPMSDPDGDGGLASDRDLRSWTENPAKDEITLPFFYIVLSHDELGLTSNDVSRLGKLGWRIEGFQKDKGHCLWYVGGDNLHDKLAVDFPFVQAGTILNEQVYERVPAYYDQGTISRYFTDSLWINYLNVPEQPIFPVHLFFADQPAPYLVSRVRRKNAAKQTSLIGITIRPDEETKRVRHLWDVRAPIIVRVGNCINVLNADTEQYLSQLRERESEIMRLNLLLNSARFSGALFNLRKHIKAPTIGKLREKFDHVWMQDAPAEIQSGFYGMYNPTFPFDPPYDRTIERLEIALEVAKKKRPAFLPPLSDRVDRLAPPQPQVDPRDKYRVPKDWIPPH